MRGLCVLLRPDLRQASEPDAAAAFGGIAMRALRVLVLAVLVFVAQIAVTLPQAVVSVAAAAEDGIADVWEPSEVNTTVTGGLPSLALGTEHPDVITDFSLNDLEVSNTASSQTFVAPDGGYTTELYPAPVNVLDADGLWQPIDNTLVPADALPYAYRNALAGHEVLLPTALDAAPVRLERDGVWLEMALQGAQAGPVEAVGASATYGQAQPGVDVAYTATNLGVKEELVLGSSAAPSAFRFDVTTSPGLTARQAVDGGLDMVTALGTTALSFAAPFMVDSAEGGGVRSDAVTLRVVQTLPTLVLELAADPVWLQDPERVWPVVVDPTVNFTAPYSDAQITSGSAADTRFGGSTVMKTGNDGRVNRAVVDFTVPETLKTAAVIRSAELSFEVYQSATADGTGQVSLGAHELLQPFNESHVTWNRRDTAANGTAVPWTNSAGTSTPGGAFTSTPESRRTVGGTAVGRHTWPVAGAVQRHLDEGRARLGFLMKNASESSGLVRLHSGEVSDSTQWPKLVVHWEPALGLAQKYRFETFELGATRNAHINVANGNLVLQERDLAIKGTGLDATVERFYNSRAVYKYDFGNRWQAVPQTAARLYVQPSGDVAYYRDGIEVYLRNANGSYTAPSGANKTLVKNSDGSYVLTTNATSVKEKFLANGYLTATVDRNNNTISYFYDVANNLIEMRDTQGRVTTFARNNKNRVHTITDPARPEARLHKYTYKKASNAVETDTLESYESPDGRKTQYEYATNGDLTGINDANNTKTKITYDSFKRVIAIELASNDPAQAKVWDFTYNAGSTVVNDASGRNTTYHYDARGRVSKVVDARGKERSTSYNSNSNVLDYTNASGGTPVAYDYSTDGRNNLTKGTLPTGASGSLKYEDTRFPYQSTSATDAQNNSVTYGYDNFGNLSNTSSGDAAAPVTTSATYNANGTVNTVTDAKGKVTSYSYDSNGNLLTVTPPAPLGPTSYTYDVLSRVLSVTDGKGQRTSYAYDKLDRVTAETGADGTKVVYNYNVVGKKTTRTLYPAGGTTQTTRYAFDRVGQLTQEKFPDNRTTDYTYDPVGNLLSLTDAAGKVSYAYDVVNRNTSVTDPEGKVTTFGYDDDGNRTSTNYPNGVVLAATYDESDRLTAIVSCPASVAVCDRTRADALTGFTYTYTDPVSGVDRGLRQTVTDLKAGTITAYSYDLLNQLKQAVTSSAAGAVVDSRAWSFDGNANRTSQTVNGTTTHYAYNDANMLCWTGPAAGNCGSAPAGATTFGYDANGSETSRSTGRTSSYTVFDQTKAITPAAGAASVPFSYAATDQDERDTAGPTRFTNGILGVQAQSADGALTSFVRDNAGTLVAKRTGSGSTASKHYYLFDGLGSVVGLTDATGALVNTYRYDPYGLDLGKTENTANPFQYTGGYLDTQTGLYKLGIRYYDPSLGRFTQPDPTGQDAHYTYAGNNPVNATDPTGAFTIGVSLTACAGSGVQACVSFSLNFLSGDATVSVGGGLGFGAKVSVNAVFGGDTPPEFSYFAACIAFVSVTVFVPLDGGFPQVQVGACAGEFIGFGQGFTL
jgi:RHS repeat-associated protein